MFSYTVRCKFSSPDRQALSDRWLAWLREEHIQDVVNGGAAGASIFEMDTDEAALLFEIRYEFSSRDAFDKYESDVAPALREEGRGKFPYELGLSYERTTGEMR